MRVLKKLTICVKLLPALRYHSPLTLKVRQIYYKGSANLLLPQHIIRLMQRLGRKSQIPRCGFKLFVSQVILKLHYPPSSKLLDPVYGKGVSEGMWMELVSSFLVHIPPFCLMSGNFCKRCTPLAGLR